MRQYRLHEMHLHSDFVQTLREMGKIPKVNLNTVIELNREKKQAEARNKDWVDKLKEALADPARKDGLLVNATFLEMIN